MEITTQKDGTTTTLMLAGRLNTVTAGEFDAAVQNECADAQHVILDLTNLEYISSAGLRSILVTHKKMADKEGLVLRGVQPAVMEVFELTGFSNILNFE